MIGVQQSRRNWWLRNPWVRPLDRARRRCNDYKHRSFPSYGGRGVQFKLHVVEVIALWYRDMAFLMKCPTLDRINADGHYELRNCRFREFEENVADRRVACTAPRLDGDWEE